MARLIDANALKAKATADPDTGEGLVYVQDIDEAPTVDAVKVVRCRDCRYWWEELNLCCNDRCCCDGNVACVDAHPEHFCSYGERKDGDGNA